MSQANVTPEQGDAGPRADAAIPLSLSEADLARIADLVADRLRSVVAPAGPAALLTKGELAAHLRVEKAQVDRWVRKGMPRETIGSVPRFELATCRAWLATIAKPRAAARPPDLNGVSLAGVTPIGRARKVV